AGLAPLVAGRGATAEAAATAAEAMRATDTHRKEAVVEGDGWTVGGMAKGAAMLAPNVATLRAARTTAAELDAAQARRTLRAAGAETLNTVTGDGCTSTNDTVILLASGAAGAPADLTAFEAAVRSVCLDLARQMVGDAEGHTKVVTVEVVGALSDE